MPNQPNGVNQTRVPSTRANATPIDSAKDDPFGTLPANAQKYEINNREWRAVPINKGIHKIVSNREGQAIYIAEDAQGTASLRITKNFNIETTGRTALYLKGQSDLDILVENVVNLLASKADKQTTYTKAQTDERINILVNQSLGSLTSALIYKGTVQNQAALNGIVDKSQGDVYQTLDTGEFYTWISSPQPGSWKKLSGTLVSLSNYYTKLETDQAISSRASLSALETLEQRVDLLLLQSKPFNYVQNSDPSINTQTDPTSEGETWFNNATGLIYIRKRSQTDQSLYWLNSLDNSLLRLDTRFVKLTGDQTISGIKTFNSLLKAATPPVADEDLTNKRYVDEAIANAGMGSTNFMTLDATTQTVLGHKTFTGRVTVPAPANSSDAATMEYVDNAIQGLQNTVPTNVVTTDTDQNITGAKTFDALNPPSYDNVNVLLTDTAFVHKKYVDDAIANNGGGGGAPIQGVALVDAPNTFTALNNFTQEINLYLGGKSLVEPTDAAHLVTKKYVDDKVQQGPTIDLSNYVTLDTNQTIIGRKTFANATITQAPIDVLDVVNKQYVDNQITAAAVDLSNYVTLDADQTITGKKTFDVLPEVTTEATADAQLTNKRYVDLKSTATETAVNNKIGDLAALNTTNKTNLVEAINEAARTGGGGNTNLTDYANKTTENTFAMRQTFNAGIEAIGNSVFSSNPTITTPKDAAALQDNDVATKAYVDLATSRIISATPPTSTNYAVGTLWIKTSYTQDQQNPNLFTDVPELYIKVSADKWWALHKEALI